MAWEWLVHEGYQLEFLAVAINHYFVALVGVLKRLAEIVAELGDCVHIVLIVQEVQKRANCGARICALYLAQPHHP
jgi:hypothetical protein